MATENSVRDEKRKLTAEELGRLQVKTNEIVNRIEKGAISYGDALEVMQKIIIENKSAEHLDVVSGMSSIVKKWWEKDGVIYFKVTSNGMTGEQWVKRLIAYNNTRHVLSSTDFKVTNGVTYEIAVLRGSLFSDHSRTDEMIRLEALKRNLITPNSEVACLIREKFSDEEIRAMRLLQIITFHEPIEDYYNCPALLSADVRIRANCLDVYKGKSGPSLSDDCGFAFEISRQTS